MKPRVVELFTDIGRIVDGIPADLGGGCPLAKSFLMVYLFLELDLRTYAEIGVYRGRSFFPLAYASRRLGGKAYGIDAYDSEVAKEDDLDDYLRPRVNSFLDSLDFGAISRDVLGMRESLGLAPYAEIIRERSVDAARLLKERSIVVDMLHIDGNHDTEDVLADIDLYVPLVRAGGIVVLDDVDWASVKPGLAALKRDLDTVFNNGSFAIFQVPLPGRGMTLVERRRLEILHSMAENFEKSRATLSDPGTEGGGDVPTVSVVVVTYNHQDFVAECLEGILAQKGDFRIELIVGDDCSTDSTLEVVTAYLNNLKSSRVEVKILPAERNLGLPHNLERCLSACSGRFVAVCEGDDYWIDSRKLDEQVRFLENHPECSLCFHDVHIYFQETGEWAAHTANDQADATVLTTKELVRDNFIGNMSCCVYDAKAIKDLDPGLFEMYVADWMVNICVSQSGDIGHIGMKMSVYRKHSKGVWAGKPASEQDAILYEQIDRYNRFLNFAYDREFSGYQKRIAARAPEVFYGRAWDVAVLDDVFPHPLSAFRLEEFEKYLEELDAVKVYTSGASAHLLSKQRLDSLVADFKKRLPERAGQLEILEPDTVINARLLYTVFLGNTYSNIDRIEGLKSPFVFTLYPGGMFGLNNARSDMMLRRVCSSPCFSKVIVTQQITYDYLISGGFCTRDQIEFIFGVVTPQDRGDSEWSGKKRFGIDKGVLDICFVGHKYVAQGIDKGYDVFVDVARALARKYDNIAFHVVGGFDENEIDVGDARGRVSFYGSRETAWFDEFYRDKDIILSPNVPSRIFEGSFDGFPTGTCVDAGLRKVAIFATDELRLNTHFIDGKELVIIPHDAARVCEIIEGYYRDPDGLKEIAEYGYLKIRQLYSYDAQMAPRIRIIREQLGLADAKKAEILRVMRHDTADGRTRALSRAPFMLRLSVAAWRRSPPLLRSGVRGGLRLIRSHRWALGVARRLCPEALVRLYLEVREFGGV